MEKSRKSGARVPSSYNSYINGGYAYIGSSALAPERVIKPEPERRPAPRPKRTKKHYKQIERRIKEKNLPEYEYIREKKAGTPALNILTVALIAFFSFIWLGVNGLAAITSSDVAKLNAQLISVTDNNNALKAGLISGIDLAAVESVATARLGMIKPQEYQKVYINVPQESYVVSYDIKDDMPEVGFSMAGILELFLKK